MRDNNHLQCNNTGVAQHPSMHSAVYKNSGWVWLPVIMPGVADCGGAFGRNGRDERSSTFRRFAVSEATLARRSEGKASSRRANSRAPQKSEPGLKANSLRGQPKICPV